MRVRLFSGIVIFSLLFSAHADTSKRSFEHLNGREFQDYLDELSRPIRSKHHHYQFRPHNQFTVLVDGIEHRHETLATVRDAKLFLNISQFELYGDRFGYILGAEIIAQLLPDYDWLLQGKKGSLEQLSGIQKQQARLNNIRRIASKLESAPGTEPYLPDKNGEYRFLENQKALVDIEQLQRAASSGHRERVIELKRDWLQKQLEDEGESSASIQKTLSRSENVEQEFARLSERSRSQLKKIPSGKTFLREAKNLKKEYARLKLKASPLGDAEQQKILSSSKRIDAFLQSTLPPLQVRLFLDPLKTNYTWSVTPLRALLPALELFGASYRLINEGEIQKLPIQMMPFFAVNHAKLVSNESRSIVSGGNIIDKVMGFNRRNLVWHDVAILCKGQLVNDINRFFFERFNSGAFDDDKAPIWRLDDPGDPWGREAARNETKLASTDRKVGGGRLIYTLPVTSWFTGSVTERTFKAVVEHAKRKIQIENAFFSDAWTAHLLIQKAKEWNLAALKDSPELKALGESGKKATCGPGSVQTLTKRGKFISVILPKYMDQPLIKMAEISLINSMLKAGIDVCKWSGKLFNTQNEDPKKRRYSEKTMLHTKAYLIDDELGLIGSPNHTRRSYRGDLELAVLFTEPTTISDLKKRVLDLDQENSEPVVAHWYHWPALLPTLGLNALQAL